MKKELILACDIGTSSVKTAVFDRDLRLVAESRNPHSYSARGCEVEMDGDLLFRSFLDALKPLTEFLPHVSAVGFSVLCPGLFCFDREGLLLRPGIIHLDRRSEKQGLELTRQVGGENFRKIAGNLPYPGGISLSSISWIGQNQPEIARKTWKYGHTNTLFIRLLTGQWGIDPTNASFTGLYDTVGFSGWSGELCRATGVSMDTLPEIIPSTAAAGALSPGAAGLTGLRSGIPVIMGAADTACAVFGAGAVNEGQLLNSTGTVEVMAVCLEKPAVRDNLLLRTHVIPGRWISMNIIGAGGESLNWVHREFFRELPAEQFFKEIPARMNAGDGGVTFTPHLAGDRTSLANKAGILSGLTLSTGRDQILCAVILGIISQMRQGMETFKEFTSLSRTIYYAGGGSNTLRPFKETAFPEHRFEQVENAALKGAGALVLLGRNSSENYHLSYPANFLIL